MTARKAAAGLFIGALFGFGLALAQMTNPEKVLSFLRLLPGWDPSLAFVMLAAIPVTLIGYRLVLGGQPLFATSFSLPTNTAIDRRLVTGSLVFGIGWGLAGYCPGPAFAALSSGLSEPFLFLLAMLAGSFIADTLPTHRPAADEEPTNA